MKNFDLNDINEYISKKGIKVEDNLNNEEDNYNVEEFDTAKTRILKYVLYKKRTENEIRVKFSSMYNEELLDDVIENLKELNYINDSLYIERAINEFTSLKNLSIKELKYKLISKGIRANELEDFILEHYEELDEYEKKSAFNIIQKKKNTLDEISLKNYLIKKGYREESIKEAL